MYTFTDKKGRTWDVSITMAEALRMDKSDYSTITDAKFSFLNPDRVLIGALQSDALLFAAIWACVQPQVESVLGISPKEKPDEAEQEFLSGLDGKTLKAGRKAFWAALGDFSQDDATSFSQLTSSRERLREKLEQKIPEMVELMDKAMDEHLEQEIQKYKDELNKLNTGGASSTESSPSLAGNLET